ncbi:unannotated protein [freshwater metagenome]|uniref:Unannotated protein n=1 Tax=freshwater metagenome TaxID=449393 RepID=A0A6J6RJ62_9ZZZZ|nr:DMT family transporter [Actinomycetota bacterium]MSV63992.1 EamA family transporter [Actinomycetota bacterium]MSW25826.1 EamA family transporter [Actinomycetota bacterium]MSW34118.1 EamA family transporter [Actinomycetota bacterium]MSX30680.1 EamA family transporter [Actinomycetota bacterium]
MAILLALFSSILWGSADFEGGRLAKRHHAIAVTGMSQAIGLAFGVIFVLLTNTWHAVAFGTGGYFFVGVIAGVMGYLGLNCLYAGLATGRMGVVSPISSLCAIIPLTIALVGGEQLGVFQVIGISIALAGAFCASGPEISQGLPLRPLLLATGAAFGFGLGLTFMAKGAASSAIMTIITMRATTLLISIFLSFKFKTTGGFVRSDFKRLSFVGIADFSANVLVGFASTRGLVSIVMVLGSLFPIATAVLAFKILHERLHKVQYIGIVLAVAGVAIISAA